MGALVETQQEGEPWLESAAALLRALRWAEVVAQVCAAYGHLLLTQHRGQAPGFVLAGDAVWFCFPG